MEIVGKISQGLAATVGQLHPMLEGVLETIADIVKSPDENLTEQFNLVNQKLEGIQDELDTVGLELQKSLMNMQNSAHELQILNQYERFQDFVNDPDNKKKKEKFLSYYEKKKKDFDLDCYYNAITDSEDPMLKKRAIIEKRNRRAVEYFCGKVMKIFVKGIIVVVCYAVQKDKEEADNVLKKWQKRMEDVKKHVKAAVDECTEKFAVQAELDMERELQEKPGRVDLEFTKPLLDFLEKKYDWVKWSIRVFNDRERKFFLNWFTEKTYDGCAGGANSFDVLTNSNIKVVFSFCVDPMPFNKSQIQIQEEIDNQKPKGDMKQVAQSLRRNFPNCLVHAVSRKEVVQANNFPKECYYYGKHNGIYLCIHPVMPHTA